MPFVARSLPRKHSLGLCIFAGLVALGATRAVQGQTLEFDAHGMIALGLQDGPATTSWLRGGIGRYLGDGDAEPSLQSHLGLSWSSGLDWEALLHLRADTRGSAGNAVGVVEARFMRHWFLRNDQRFSLGAGQMFLPTSVEAVDPLWQSRYTLNLSALNSWIAEEFRPIGLRAELQSSADALYRWGIGSMIFGGNDSAGALLAWRGFALHDRLSVSGEILPLPELPSLADGGAFGEQRDAGTRPFGRDLDGRVGFAAHGRWGQAEVFELRAAAVNTRGDRELHRGEYAWNTRFSLIGADWQLHPQWTLASEFMRGRTGMGPRGSNAVVDIDFDAFYALLSWAPNESWRWSTRWDRFDIEDRDGTPNEDNSENGDAWTLSVFWTPVSDWRLAAEWTETDSNHTAAPLLGSVLETGGSSFRVEARYRF